MCPPIFPWLENVTKLRLYLENSRQNDSLILRCRFWVMELCRPVGDYRLIESVTCLHLRKSTVNIRIQTCFNYELNAHFLYSITIRMLHYNPRHFSTINMPIIRRTNYIIMHSQKNIKSEYRFSGCFVDFVR
jgi:hypothetical protein